MRPNFTQVLTTKFEYDQLYWVREKKEPSKFL
jgi:hypothetical protein